MAKVLPLVAYEDLDSQAEALERDGYVYFPSVLDADGVAQLRETMDRLETIDECFDRHQTPENGDKFLNKILNNSFNRDPPYLNKFQFDEAILAQANPRQRRLLGEHRPSNYDCF